jgi:hypothetical protein
VPDHRFRDRVNQMLRDDILAQLRTARRPMSTSELCAYAPALPPRPGASVRLRPPHEHVYRALRRLCAEGAVTRHNASGRAVSWVATNDICDREIAELESAYHAEAATPPATPVATPAETLHDAAEHLKAAARTATQVAHAQPEHAGAITAVLSHLVTRWADVITIAAHEFRTTQTGSLPETHVARPPAQPGPDNDQNVPR